jgi:hypothetical protein
VRTRTPAAAPRVVNAAAIAKPTTKNIGPLTSAS